MQAKTNTLLRRMNCWLLILVSCASLRADPPSTLPSLASIREAIQRANDYYIANNQLGDNGWDHGAYETGNMLAYQVLGLTNYLQWAINWATTNGWQIGYNWPAFPDGQACGQTYIDLYRLDPQPIRIAAIKSAIDDTIATPSAVTNWYWIDAFFMAAPVFARLGNLYPTNSYFDNLWLMYDDMKTRRGLFDPTYGLWYENESAKTAVTQHGQKQFWGRGDGWVIAGVVRVLEQMPLGAAHRSDFVTMLQTMAAALKPWQGADGMWRSSLLDPTEYPTPETSGTGFFVYALAWGVRNGYLSAADYQPVVARGWNGMVATALHADGFLGYVQATASAPGPTDYNTTFDYGVGAFLLAGSEVLRLAASVPFQINNITVQTNGVLITWTAPAGQTNAVQSAGSVNAGYTNVSPNMFIPGSLTTTTNYLDASGATNWPARFYRIQATTP